MYSMRWSIAPPRRRAVVPGNNNKPAAASGLRPPHRRRVLLVEKGHAGASFLAAFLAHKGFHVSSAEHADQALRCLARPPLPDLILLDLDTALEEGLEVCRQRLQRASLAAIPLVAVSSGQHVPAPLAVALGIVAHLHKPVCQETLLETVQRLCA